MLVDADLAVPKTDDFDKIIQDYVMPDTLDGSDDEDFQ